MMLIELGRIAYAVPFLIVMFTPGEDANPTVEKVSDISLIVANFLWIGLAINISGHFSFFKTQLALKSDPEGYKEIAENDRTFQKFVDILIGCEIVTGLALVAFVIAEPTEATIAAIRYATLIFFTLLALALIILSFCKMSRFLHDIPKHEKN